MNLSERITELRSVPTVCDCDPETECTNSPYMGWRRNVQNTVRTLTERTSNNA